MLLYAFDPPDSSRKVGTQEPAIRRFVGESTNGSKPQVDSSGGDILSLFEVDPVARHHGLVEGEAGFRAVPVDEFTEETIAFAVDGNPDLPGRYQFSLDGEGGTSIRFTASTPGTPHELTVYEHFVSPPVQIGAITSPTSMLSPLVATCDAKQFLLSRIQAPRIA